jgi:hypothetical protein
MSSESLQNHWTLSCASQAFPSESSFNIILLSTSPSPMSFQTQICSHYFLMCTTHLTHLYLLHLITQTAVCVEYKLLCSLSCQGLHLLATSPAYIHISFSALNNAILSNINKCFSTSIRKHINIQFNVLQHTKSHINV